MNVFDYLTLIFSILLIISVLLQNSQDDIADAFSGSKSDLFKNKKSRGVELYIKWISGCLTFSIVLFVILANFLRTI